MERILFPEGLQKEFMKTVVGEENLKAFIERNELDVRYSAFKKYYNGKLTLPVHIFDRLCEVSRVNKSSLRFSTVNRNWGAIKGGKKGMESLMRRYDRETISKWKGVGGRNSKGGGRSLVNVRFPESPSERFSEFVGAHLGDGTLTKYFLRITGDKRYDIGYLNHLASIIEEEVGLKPSIKTVSKRNLAYLEVRSRVFCEKLHGQYGIPYGDKILGKARIPAEILADDRLTKACIRGLIDTDGTVSRRGNYMCLCFNSRNDVLLEQVWKICSNLGVFSHKYGDEVGTNSWPLIEKYFSVIGSSNMRHIVRFREKSEHNRFLYKTEVLRYFNKYEGTNLPYKKTGPWSSG